jgi:ribose 5-phosphate isomerase B
MRIYIASDHAGFELKEALTVFLRERGIEVDDSGATAFNTEDDYPDFILPMAAKTAQDKGSFGIGIGASGQGEAIVANRVKGARAVVYYGHAPHTQTDAAGKVLDMLESTRLHNDANILCLGARFLTIDQAKEAVGRWLAAPFSNDERHARRIKKIDAAR